MRSPQTVSTGTIRRSEVLGLRWSSIDLQGGWIHIDTTVVKEKIGNNVVTTVRENTTKTEYSRRDLPLCPYTHQYFLNLRNQQLRQMQICGSSYDQRYLDFVCVDQMGTILQPDYVSQKFQQLLQKYELRPIRFHDLRHPYVKHTTKKYNSEKQKTQTTNLSADSLGFLFLLFILRLCP